MTSERQATFIFYLTLEERLPRTFYLFDNILKDLGLILVPVRIDQLQTLAASTDQSHLIVISAVTDAREYKMFNEKVRGLLKYIIKGRRLTFMQLSSFSKLNDSKMFAIYKNYFFLKCPLNARVFLSKVARYYELKSEKSVRWPGGRRAGLGNLVV